jgi:hypothetical protein
MLLELEDKIINTDHITYAVYAEHSNDKHISVVVNFIGGGSTSFKNEAATSLWERLRQVVERTA